MNALKRFKAWRESYNNEVKVLEMENTLFNEVERILEKAEKSSCEGCKYSGDASFNGMKVCTECCNNYYNKWTARKTRQSEFLKMFPNADLIAMEDYDVVTILPCVIDFKMRGTSKCNERNKNCVECRKAYWNEEVE